MPDIISNASPARRAAIAAIIGREAEAIFDRAQRLQEEADSLYLLAKLGFVESDRLDPRTMPSGNEAL